MHALSDWSFRRIALISMVYMLVVCTVWLGPSIVRAIGYVRQAQRTGQPGKVFWLIPYPPNWRRGLFLLLVPPAVLVAMWLVSSMAPDNVTRFRD